MPASSPYYVLDDEEDVVSVSDSDIEFLDYDSDSSGPSILSLESDDSSTTNSPANFSNSSTNRHPYKVKSCEDSSICLPDVELHKYKLNEGKNIEAGDTVELIDHSKQDADAMHSGDFLRIKHILMDLSTDEVRIRGHLLRRTKYLGQIFDWKLNELAMVLRVDENDNRSPFVAGMQDFAIDQVLGKRDCVLTNKCFPFQSFRTDASSLQIPRSTSKQDAVRKIFHSGRLCCRVVYIRFISHTGKDASGVVRHLYNDEIHSTKDPTSPPGEPGSSRQSSLAIQDDEVTGSLTVRGKRSRSDSIEMLQPLAPKRRSSLPVKEARYTYGDVFCGGGGASQGATQAGLHVRWGLDNDEHALRAFHLNHPGALPFCRNAHHFPPPGFTTSDLRVDVLHLSPPCCYWSPAHTQDGKNDQANYEAIYTVGPILEAVKPRIATLEQTFGLMTHEQHQRNFRMLLYDIGKAGYDLRYKIQDMSKLGLVQKRKRLLIIAARRGTPLPPFPEDTHGEEGTCLKPFVFIDDVLKVMERLGPRALNDVYHQPKPMAKPKPAYDPHRFLKGCITVSGGENYHFEGKRRYTAREMSLFQSFPYHYQFSGSHSQAMRQVGNAFPPRIAEEMYRSIIATLHAFDDGLIGAEDDLTDLEGVFAQTRLRSSRSPSAPPSLSSSNSRRIHASHQDSTRAKPRNSDKVERERSNPLTSSLMTGLLDNSSDASSTKSATPQVRETIELDDDDSDDEEVVYIGSSYTRD